MTVSELRRITERHSETVDKIVDILEKAKIPAIEGEAILLHIAGLSAGNRQQSVVGDWLLPLSISWGFAAEMGGV